MMLRFGKNHTAVLELLNNTDFVSGMDIANRISVSKATVHKVVRDLNTAGLKIHAVRGRGYRLAGKALNLLKADTIAAHLAKIDPAVQCQVEVLSQVESTNSYLRSQARHQLQEQIQAVLTECQSAGRGRRGREWYSSPFRNITLSMAYPLNRGMSQLGGLSLAIGLAVKRALLKYGIQDVALKWPNDLVVNGAKLGGILIEVDGELSSSCMIVAGVGLNVDLENLAGQELSVPTIDFNRLGFEGVDRNRLSAFLIVELAHTIRRFGEQGFAAFREAWEKAHYYHGRSVTLILDRETISGRVVGVGDDGALKLSHNDGTSSQWSVGEISMRPKS